MAAADKTAHPARRYLADGASVARAPAEAPPAPRCDTPLRCLPARPGQQPWIEWAAVVEASDDAIFGLSLDGTITSWNSGAAELYGYTAEEIVGRSIRLLVPSDQEDALNEVLARVAAGAHLKNIEGERLSKRHQRLPVLMTLSPILYAGRPLGIAATERDARQRKAAEAAMQTLHESLEQRVAQRTAALNLLYDMVSAANEAETVDDAIRYVLERLAQDRGWCYAHAYLPAGKPPHRFLATDLYYSRQSGRFDALHAALRSRPLQAGRGLPGRVLAEGLPEWVIDLCDERRLRGPELAGTPELVTAAAFPVLVGERVVAVLEFFADQVLQPDASMLESMASIGIQLGRVVERKELERQIAQATAREQRRVGQELHDSVAQQLTGISMIAETLRQQLESAQAAQAGTAALLVEHVKNAQVQVRRLSRGLMPVEVDAGGLMSSLSWLVESYQKLHNFECTFDCTQPVALQDNATSTHLYRIAQEALQNVAKHAQARRVVVRLESVDGRVRLCVSDDGRGIPEGATPLGIGHRIMRYRAGVIGALLEIRSSEDAGTTVICTMKQGEKQETL